MHRYSSKPTESLLNISEIQHVQETLPSPPETPLPATSHCGKPSLRGESVLPATTLLNSYTRRQKRGSINGPLLTSTPAIISSSISKDVNSQLCVCPKRPSFKLQIERTNHAKPKVQTGDISEISTTEEHQRLIEEIRKEHEWTISQLKKDHLAELERGIWNCLSNKVLIQNFSCFRKNTHEYET